MKVSFASFTALAAVVSAIPLKQEDRSIAQALASANADINTLQFALYLENFSNAFYREGLANFTQADFAHYGFDADFYSNLTDIASQERTHVRSISTTLDQLHASKVAECNWAFNVTNPLGFVITASLVESVSTSAYLGIVAHLPNPNLQAVAASILAVEARHSSFIRASLGQQPFATPFETPITLEDAYTLAELFKVSCPASNPSLHLEHFKQLSSSFSNHGVIGREITLLTFHDNIQATAGGDGIYVAFLTITGPIFAPATPVPGQGYKCKVPASPEGYAPINGFTYVLLTNSNTTLADDNILAGPATLEIYLK